MKRLILPLPGNEALAAALAKACNGELGGIATRRCPSDSANSTPPISSSATNCGHTTSSPAPRNRMA